MIQNCSKPYNPNPTPALLSALTLDDKAALRRALALPTPKDDGVNGTDDIVAILSGPPETTASIWQKLQISSDIRVQIATAVLRGDLTRLPDDPRLHPLPYPGERGYISPCGTTKSPGPATPQTTPTGNPVWHSPDARLTYVQQPNPKKPGSAARARYALWRVGLTVTELRALGVQTSDFRWDAERGFVRFAPTETSK